MAFGFGVFLTTGALRLSSTSIRFLIDLGLRLYLSRAGILTRSGDEVERHSSGVNEHGVVSVVATDDDKVSLPSFNESDAETFTDCLFRTDFFLESMFLLSSL